MSSIGTVGIRIVPSMAGFGATVSSAVAASGPAVARAGAAAGLLISAPIGLAVGKSIQEAVNFESGFAGVEKTVGGTADEMARIESGIRGLAKELPFTHEELNRMAEAVGRFGIPTEDIVNTTEMFAKLGVAIPEMDATVAAENMVRFFNVMGTAPSAFEPFLSSVVDLGNNLATSEPQIIEFASRLAQASTVANVTEADILGIAGAFSAMNIRPMAGASSISRVFFTMDEAVKGSTEKMDTFLGLLDISEDKFRELYDTDPAGLFISLLQGMKDAEAEGQALTSILDELGINDIRVRRTLAAGIKDPAAVMAAVQMARDAAAENQALETEFGTRAGTTASKWKVFKNRVRDAAIELGTAFLPALLDIMEALEPAIDLLAAAARGFAGLPEPVQKLGIAFLAIVVALGPMVFLGSQVIRIARGMNAAFLLLRANPVILILTAIALVAILIITNWDTVKQWFLDFFAWMDEEWDQFYEMLMQLWDDIQLAWQIVWDSIKAWFQEKINQIRMTAQMLWDKFIEIWDWFGGLPERFGDMWSRLVEIMRAAKDEIVRMANEIWSAVDNALGPLDEIAMSPITGAKWLYNNTIGRASGGGVLGGTPYLVGEKGPEMFVPGRSGSVIPNANLGGNVTNVFKMDNVVIRDERDIEDLARALARHQAKVDKSRGVRR